ncbi:MAG: YihY/virulence factor BrkB family protein [Aquihabitans sp.]
MKQRLRQLGQRWPWFDRVLDVQDRYGEINGSFVSSGITVAIFIAVFPLLLVAIAIVGFVASNNDQFASQLIDELGLTGTAAQTMTDSLERASNSKQAASIVGLLGLLWTGSGVAVALQQGIRAPWQERSAGMRDRFRGMAWLATAGLGFAASIALGGLLNVLPDGVPVVLITALAVIVGMTFNIGLFWWMFKGLGTGRVPNRRLLPGAIMAGVGFEVLKLVGTVYVPRLVARSSGLYGSLGIVFAILAWLALFARLIVYASTLNAVLYESTEGTVQVPVHVPDIAGKTPTAATRGGIAVGADDDPPAVPSPE